MTQPCLWDRGREGFLGKSWDVGISWLLATLQPMGEAWEEVDFSLMESKPQTHHEWLWDPGSARTSVSSPVKRGGKHCCCVGSTDERVRGDSPTNVPLCPARRLCGNGSITTIWSLLRSPKARDAHPASPREPGPRRGGSGRGEQGRVAFRPTGPLCAALNYHLPKTNPGCISGFPFQLPWGWRAAASGVGGGGDEAQELSTNQRPRVRPRQKGERCQLGQWKAHVLVPASPRGHGRRAPGSRLPAPDLSSETSAKSHTLGSLAAQQRQLSGGLLLLPTPGVPAVGVPMLPAPPEPVTHVPGHMVARDGLSVAPAHSPQAQRLQTTAAPRGEGGGRRRAVTGSTGWGAGSRLGKRRGTDSALPGQPNS